MWQLDGMRGWGASSLQWGDVKATSEVAEEATGPAKGNIAGSEHQNSAALDHPAAGQKSSMWKTSINVCRHCLWRGELFMCEHCRRNFCSKCIPPTADLASGHECIPSTADRATLNCIPVTPPTPPLHSFHRHMEQVKNTILQSLELQLIILPRVLCGDLKVTSPLQASSIGDLGVRLQLLYNLRKKQDQGAVKDHHFFQDTGPPCFIYFQHGSLTQSSLHPPHHRHVWAVSSVSHYIS